MNEINLKIETKVSDLISYYDFLSTLYSFYGETAFAVNSTFETLEFDCIFSTFTAFKECINMLPDENEKNLKGVISFILQFNTSRYNEQYKRLLHSCIDSEKYEICIKDNEEDFSFDVEISSRWAFNLKRLVKYFKEENV